MKKLFLIILALAAIFQYSDARQPRRGYRGFVEWSSSVRSDAYAKITTPTFTETYRETTFYTGMTTSHGYQLNSMYFIGAGLGMERCGKVKGWIIPVFLQGRIDLKLGKFTPFGDLRLGANLADGAGVYFSPTVGYRFNWGRKVGVNIGAGLTLAGYRAEHYEGKWEAPDSYEINYIGTKHHVDPYFSFRLGIDF